MKKSKIKNQKYKSKIKNFEFCSVILIFTFCTLNFSGCATAPMVIVPKAEGIPGIYHRVIKGQTLWGISKIYNLNLDELVSINHITDASNIEVGQIIFIPHRKKPEPLPNMLSSEDFMWPTKGKILLVFGQTSNNRLNKGINIQAHSGSDVVASRSGKVVFYNPNFVGFGKTIIIDHQDGFTTVYARNSEVFVKVGDEVRKGAPIAKVGSSNDRDKNIYLHFEIRKGYISQNPYFYLPR